MILILTIQISLFVLFSLFVFLTFMAGFRYGVDVTVNVYLDETLKQTTQAAVRHEYINDRREFVQEANYQKWRRKYKLPNTLDTRDLYNDADYRAALEAQEGG